MIFDGKAFARTIEDRVKEQVSAMPVKPKIVSVLVGNDPASELYTRLKKAAAERVGIQFDVLKLDLGISKQELENRIRGMGARGDVTGVMVQLPLPADFKGSTLKVLEAIPLDKDVDGLRWEESGVMPATVRAILAIVDKIAQSKIINSQILKSGKYVVMGARGAVGKPLTHFLRERKAEVLEVEWDTPNPFDLVAQGEVVISCVGKAGTVTGEMVRDGVIAIDVGMSPVTVESQGHSVTVSPKVVGDMTDEVYAKASVAVPVPGGVGPVTVASLMMNSLDLL